MATFDVQHGIMILTEIGNNQMFSVEFRGVCRAAAGELIRYESGEINDAAVRVLGVIVNEFYARERQRSEKIMQLIRAMDHAVSVNEYRDLTEQIWRLIPPEMKQHLETAGVAELDRWLVELGSAQVH